MAQGPAVHHHDQTIRYLLAYIPVAFGAYSLLSVVNSVTRFCPSSLIQKPHREEGSTSRSASLAACVVEAGTLVAVFGGPASAMMRW